MSLSLKIISILFCIFVIVFILFLLRKKRINIKYSIILITLFSILLISILIPGLIESITKILGFQVVSNMVFSLIIGLLVLINIFLTMIVSSHDKKIRLLIQEVSILKEKHKWYYLLFWYKLFIFLRKIT